MTHYIVLDKVDITKLTSDLLVVSTDKDNNQTVICSEKAFKEHKEFWGMKEGDDLIEESVPSIEPYTPVCPRGYTDCVWDPAYIKNTYPEWYAELYGDMTPEEAIHTENGCYDKFVNDPEETFYCYDDEDK